MGESRRHELRLVTNKKQIAIGAKKLILSWNTKKINQKKNTMQGLISLIGYKTY